MVQLAGRDTNTSSDSWQYSADRPIKQELQNFDNLRGTDITSETSLSGAGARLMMTYNITIGQDETILFGKTFTRRG